MDMLMGDIDLDMWPTKKIFYKALLHANVARFVLISFASLFCGFAFQEMALS